MHVLKIVERIIKYGFYALFVITPLLFNPIRQIPSYELFEFSKMMFVYLLTIVIVTAWFTRMILYKKIVFQKTPLDIPLVLFLGSQILATFFSIDRHVSLFGYYSRFHGGLISTIAYTALFYAFVSNRDLISLKKLLGGIFISGFFVAGYGILERFGIDAHIWVQDVQSRVFSTLGQPNWLAAYLSILLPFGIYQYFTHLKEQKIDDSTKIQSLPAGEAGSKFKIQNDNLKIKNYFGNPFTILIFAFCIISYICLLFTKSRSGFLGFWIANTVFWGIFWLRHKLVILIRQLAEKDLRRMSDSSNKLRDSSPSAQNDKKVFISFLILNATFLILNFFIKTPLAQYNKIATVELFSKESIAPQITPIGSSVIDVGITDSAKIRQIVWTGALDIIKAFPLFGTGPETFAFSYYRYRPAAHNLTSEWDFLYNRAHNEFLNMGATSGIVGLSTYVFLILSVFIFGSKKMLHTAKNPERIFLVAVLAAYTSIHITNFFGFSVVIVGIYFYLLPAFIFGFKTNQPSQQKANVILSNTQKLGIGFVLFIFFALLITLGKIWLADSFYARSYSLRRQESFAQAYEYIAAASNWRNDEPIYHDERATIAASLSTLAFSENNATSAANYASEAMKVSTIALTISPQNVNFWKSRTRILYEFASFDPSFLANALESITIAKELAPTDAKIAYNRAVLLGESKKLPEAIVELENAIQLKPDYRDAYMALAIFYEQSEQKEKAIQTLQLVLQRINPEDAEVKDRIEKMK